MNEKKSFWTTLPGILTGIAMVISAIGGLIGGLYATGIMDGKTDEGGEFTVIISVEGKGTTNPSPGTHTYDKGTQVPINALPDSDWEFDYWSGAISETSRTITVTMDADKSITASFKAIPITSVEKFTITIAVAGQGTTNPGLGSHTYDDGQQVTVTATPSSGYSFDHWEGHASGSSLSTTITMDGNKGVTAYFVLEKISPVLDQNNEPPWTGGWTNINPGASQQSFIPKYPVLVAVEVNIVTGNTGRGDDSITMKILKDGVTLASSSLFVSEGFNGWLRFDIPEGGTTVPVGNTLIIRLEDTGKTVFGWKYAGDTYAFGSRFWSGSPDYGDFFFRTYGK